MAEEVSIQRIAVENGSSDHAVSSVGMTKELAISSARIDETAIAIAASSSSH